MMARAPYIQYLRGSIIAAIAGLMSGGFAGGIATVLSPPATLTPGSPVTLNVQFSKTTDEPEKRVIVRLDLHQSGTDAKLASAYSDNTGAGYTGQTGTVPVTLAVPANVSGSCYFRATLSPWSLNRAIVAHYKTYPTNGTFTYLWSGGGYGVTQNVYYLGSLVAPKPSGATCYCSGLAFEAAVIPFNAYNVQYGHPYIGTLNTVSKMITFRVDWYGASTDKEKLAALAIPKWAAGREITDFEEAQEGDFVQLWRTSGSGHNPVFVNWVRDGTGKITRVRYWGSQGSTNGIGYNTETFSDSGGSVEKSRFYLGRLAKPRDQADYDWAIAQGDTQASPSVVRSAISDWLAY